MELSCDFADNDFVGYTGGDANVQNQHDEIRNKAIYQTVANAMAERGYSRTQEQCQPRSYILTNLHFL